MVVILYASKHGSTRKIARVLKSYLEDCQVMNVKEIDWEILDEASTVVIGIPVYFNHLEEDMVAFIRNNQEFLIAKHYSIYVTALFYHEFMRYMTSEFDYQILKHVKVIAGLGGALYYPELTVREKMGLKVMNSLNRVIPKEHHGEIFENFNDEEIRIFARKIQRIDSQHKKTAEA